jgi:hypothetical protein
MSSLVAMNSKCPLVLSSIAIVLLTVVLYWDRATGRLDIRAPTSISHPKHRTYTTTFSLAEDPISEGDNWIGGRTVGLDWSNIQTTPAHAYGAVLTPGNYNDPTALLTGSWGANQTAEATVYSTIQSDTDYDEVELRLRSALSAHVCTGYEIDFRVSSSPKAYLAIVRWNGALGNFTYLVTYRGSRYGVSNGDVIKASMVGTTITVYKNGIQIGGATDHTYATGAPGIGMDGPIGTNRNWGFSSFTASD